MSGRAAVLFLLALLSLKADGQSCSPQGAVRLVNGAGSYEGNVQVCNQGKWGFVCGNSWSTSDAQVVCRQLGYSVSNSQYYKARNNYYGFGNGTIWLDYVYCSGSESNLLSCSRAYAIGVYYCSYTYMAGVYCHQPGSCTTGAVRLSSFNYSPRSEGRVEYCYNNQWGTVCDDYWGSPDTRVVCRQLGFSDSVYNTRTYAYYYYGYGIGSIWLDDVQCSGSETSLSACSKRLNSHNCNHYEDIAVRCYGRDTTSCTNNDVRLWSAYGHTDQGLMQVCVSGTWRSVCDSYYSCYVARVFCQQLGYAGAVGVRSNAGYMYGYYYDNYQYRYYCYSSHTSLSQCYRYYYSTCSSYTRALGVACVGGSSGSECTNGSVRLTGVGATANSGRVEYCYQGTWSPFCSLSSNAANLLCKALGYTKFSWGTIYNDERFNRSDTKSLFNYIYCNTGATQLSDCTIYTKGGGCYLSESTCYREYGLRCYNPGDCTDGQVRLANGTIQQEGRIEICINGVWSSVCQYGFNTIDGYVFCSQLGYDGASPSIYYNSVFGPGNGPIGWSYIYCQGWETSIHDCTKSVYPSFTCYPQYTIGVTCKENCDNGDVRLLGGGFDNEGTVEVCYNNIWGVVADNGWTDADARVVCNQLGYTVGMATPLLNSHYGKPNKTVHFRDVSCSGNELNLAECSKTVLSLSNGKLALAGTEVAGVDCIYDVPTPPPCVPKNGPTSGSDCAAGSVRLVTSTGSVSSDAGRAEYCYNGLWTPFCNMDTRVGSVICRQNGHTAYSWASVDVTETDYVFLSNYSLFSNISCTGSETSISYCQLNESPDDCTPNCPYNSIVVRCFGNAGTSCTEGSVRLVDGLVPNEGRVEVCVNSVWGSVCTDGWDTTDAHIVCTQLGHPELQPRLFTRSYFGDGDYPIVYSNLGCGGWENALGACNKDNYNDFFSCTRDNVAGLLCGANCADGDVKLVGGYGAYEGSVQFCFENIWGLVAQSGWNLADAQVICRQLGYETAGTQFFTGLEYGKDASTILLSDVDCSGTEGSLADCTFSSMSLPAGKAALQAATGVAGVRCYHPDNCVTPVTGGSDCIDGQLRLSGDNAQNGEGNLEYCYMGTWSSFCTLGANEATVACRQLGFTVTELVSVFDDGRYGGSISNVSQFQNFTCSTQRTEFSLTECALVDDCQSKCQNAIGIRCSTPNDCMDGDVRLVNGSIAQEGRVEVCYNNIWGPLCGDGFDQSDAFVVCRELGLGSHEPTAYTNSYFGSGTGPVLYSKLGCRGYESTIVDCSKSTYGDFSCTRGNIAGVTCQDSCSDGDVQLVGGSSNSEGTVEICYYNFWGLVGDSGWSNNAANVVCRQLGFTSGGMAKTNSFYGKPNKTAQVTTAICSGSESTLNDCDIERVPAENGRDVAAAIQAAGVMCTIATVGNPGGSTGGLSGNGGAVGISVVAVFLVIAIIVVIVLIAIIILQRRTGDKNIATGPGVRMSGLEERGVQNPLAMDEEEPDFVTSDKEMIIEAMGKE